MTLCIYHGACFDGFTAAWAVWKRFGYEFDYHAGVYGEAPPDVSNRDVVVVDFSYKRNVMRELARSARSILVLDHHKTASDDLHASAGTDEQGPHVQRLDGQPLTWDQHMDNATVDSGHGVPYCEIYAQFDMDRSGAGIAWDFFHPGEARPRFLAHAEDRDLWRFKMEGTREVHAAMSAYPFTFEAWEEIYAANIADLIREGAAIDRKHKRDIETLVPIMRHRVTIGGHEVWAASLPMTMTSDAGHLMAQGEPFAACYWDTPAGRTWSLRSIDGGLDVSEIAKAYGGGGHKNAAGFQLPHGVSP